MIGEIEVAKIVKVYQTAMLVMFEKGIRENATPPIKGEITKGKMRWRGIRCVTQQGSGASWLEQRGRKITETFGGLRFDALR